MPLALLAPTALLCLTSVLPPDPPAAADSGDVLRSQEMALNDNWLGDARAGGVITLPLTEGRTLVGLVRSTQQGPDGATVVTGTLPSDPIGAFSLSFQSGQVSGGIWTSHGAHGLAPTGRSDASGRPVVMLQEWAPGRAVRCAFDLDTGPIAPADERLHRLAAGIAFSPRWDSPADPHGAPYAQGACACADDQATIDVMFVYTTLAKNAAGGAAALQARVSDAVASCNIAFTDSGLNTGGANRLAARVAGFAELSYDEVAPQWLDHLSRLANPTDGFIDQAVAMRDAAHADTVCLIVEDTRFFGGAGFYAVYVRDAAAKVLNWRAMGAGSLTFAHELGHNFGCAHDRGNSSFSLFTYAWGHSFAANSTTYGTLMSYTGAVFVPRFSNPNQSIATGQPIGVPLQQPLPAYNALAVGQTRWVLAGYGDSGRIVDCNGNGLDDTTDIAAGRSADANGNCRPDECEQRIFVDAANTGSIDGLSWNTAFRDLGEAMTFASLGCNNVSEVWVADGVYRPDRASNDRYARFELRGGLSLIGGFQGKSRPGGGETSPSQRVLGPEGRPVFASVLTGDIGTPGIHTDNCYNVLIAPDVGPNAVLDGFTVERGFQDYAGAGLWVSEASPTIRRCTFRNNRGGDSGAIEVVGAGSDPAISDCAFESNTAVWSGGCVGVRNGASATFERCVFRSSAATYGGAAALAYGSGAIFRDCSFTDNAASSNSGAIDCYVDNHLTLEGCELLRNHATGGSAGAVLLHSGCTGIVTNTEFHDNAAQGTGGGLWLQDSTATFTDCIWTGNSAGDGGGAASSYGGAGVTLTRCTLTNNTARWGGGLALGNAPFVLRNTALHANTATAGNGGGIDAYGATASSLLSSALTANSSSDSDGGLSLGSGSNLSIVNSTIASNRGESSGGGIGIFNSVLTIGNSILWGNTAGSPGAWSVQDQQLLVFSASRTVNRSCVQGLSGQLGGSGNIGADPLLTDAPFGNVAPLPGSPCIDSGSNALLPAGADTDLLGGPRRVDDPDTTDNGVGTAPIVDRGAVEFAPGSAYCPADFNQDGGIDGADVDAFFAQWEAGDATADVNQDGGVDGSDVDFFFGVWEAGGC